MQGLRGHRIAWAFATGGPRQQLVCYICTYCFISLHFTALLAGAGALAGGSQSGLEDIGLAVGDVQAERGVNF